MSTELLQAFCENIRPPDKAHPEDWVSEHVYVARSGARMKYRSTFSPWWREIFGWLPDNALKEIDVVASPGLGKSTFIEGSVAYLTAEETGNILFVSHNESAVNDELDSGIIPTLEQCSALELLLPKRRERRKDLIRLAHKTIYAWPANQSGLQEVSVRWGLGDECWQWKNPFAFQHMESRTHDRWNSRLILLSQAWEVDTEWHKRATRGDQFRWAWACQRCQHRNAYKFRRDMKWDEVTTAGRRDFDEIAKTVRMICPECGAEYRDTIENRRKLCDSGAYLLTDKGEPQRRTAYIPALTKYSIPWAALVREFLLATEQAKLGLKSDLKTFITQRLSEWDDPRAARAPIKRSAYSMSEYVNGESWEKEFHRVMTIDKQANCYWVIRAWSQIGESRLLWFGSIMSDMTLVDLASKYKLKPELVYMDSGYSPQLVYRLCNQNGWCAIRGEDVRSYKYNTGDGILHLLYSEIESMDIGNNLETCPEIKIADDPTKDVLHHLRTGKGRPWEVARDVDEEYFKQMNDETKTLDGGRWKWRASSKEYNHGWDLEKYQISVALFMGVLGAEAVAQDTDVSTPQLTASES